MKRIILALCVLTTTAVMHGCASLPAEERSFAVALGISVSGDTWETTARIPSYQQDGGYLTLSARGASLSEAMALLNATAPMQLHYGQLRIIVFSRELAESSVFPNVLDTLAARPDVRLQASICVTEDSMTELMDALEPQTGTRLSKSIESLLETRLNLGVVPTATLSSIRRMGERENPVLICVALEQDVPGTAIGMGAPAGEQTAKGAGKVQFGGGWLVGKNGMVRGRLTVQEQQLLTLLNGELRRGVLAIEEGTVTLIDADSNVRLRDGKAVCSVTIRYNESSMTEENVIVALEKAFYALTGKLAAAGCDALGIGRQALKFSATLDEWHELRWPERYPAMPWEITVRAYRAA